MEHLHDELRREKHTKHGGRMQYGLFLKGIGLSLEQALIFWQTAFANKTPDEFNKQYAYNVRHSYGMEGKRTDYTPYRYEKNKTHRKKRRNASVLFLILICKLILTH